MQFTNSLISAIMAFSALSLAAPAPAPELQVRAHSKLSQYSKPNCLDNSGGKVPTCHAAPVAQKCYNIDSTTVSFLWAIGPLSNMHVYADSDCGGPSVDIGKNGQCQSVNVKYSDGFQKIKSIKMT